jgi:mycothiol synthase
MLEIVNAYDLEDLGEPDTTRQHLADSWRVAGFDAEGDTWLVHGPGAVPAAFGLVEPTSSDVLESFGRVHPEQRGLGLGAFLAASMEARAAQRGAVRLHNAATATDAAARALLEGRGYELVRFFWHMEGQLLEADAVPPTVPDGFSLRPAGRADERPAWLAIDEAFVDHWSWVSEPFDEWIAFTRSAGERILVAVEGREVAGAITFRTMDDVGWVGELGVRPRWRGRGLGEGLLRSAFAELRTLGARSVRLNVDADNRTGATRLYERVGMHVRREWLVYEKRFGAG